MYDNFASMCSYITRTFPLRSSKVTELDTHSFHWALCMASLCHPPPKMSWKLVSHVFLGRPGFQLPVTATSRNCFAGFSRELRNKCPVNLHLKSRAFASQGFCWVVCCLLYVEQRFHHTLRQHTLTTILYCRLHLMATCISSVK